MKIFKYIVFISILSGIFFIIYRQSDKKGFRRWWTSFKTAIIFSAIAAGLIPVNPESIEPPGNNNQVYQERVINDRDVNLFEDNDQQVILAKAEYNPVTPPTNRGPNNFPTPPSEVQPSQPVYVPKYRRAPKIVNPGLGAGANPAGAGGGEAAEFDDQCPVPENQQSQESKVFEYDYRSNAPKKKKQSAEQGELDENVNGAKIEIIYRIKENPALVREAQRMGKDQAAQKDVNHLIEQLSLGNENPGIGSEPIGGGISELRGYNEGRVYYRKLRKSKKTVYEVLGKSNKDNQKKIIALVKKYYL